MTGLYLYISGLGHSTSTHKFSQNLYVKKKTFLYPENAPTAPSTTILFESDVLIGRRSKGPLTTLFSLLISLAVVSQSF